VCVYIYIYICTMKERVWENMFKNMHKKCKLK